MQYCCIRCVPSSQLFWAPVDYWLSACTHKKRKQNRVWSLSSRPCDPRWCAPVQRKVQTSVHKMDGMIHSKEREQHNTRASRDGLFWDILGFISQQQQPALVSSREKKADGYKNDQFARLLSTSQDRPYRAHNTKKTPKVSLIFVTLVPQSPLVSGKKSNVHAHVRCSSFGVAENTYTSKYQLPGTPRTPHTAEHPKTNRHEEHVHCVNFPPVKKKAQIRWNSPK